MLSLNLVIILTIAVTIAVWAAPIYDPRRESDGMAIPLTKHSSLRLNFNKNIYIDVIESRHGVASHSSNKTGGMNSLERDTGMVHPSAVKRVGSPQSSAAGVDLTNWHDNDMWYGTISIGTPPRSFTVQFDTGFSGFFVPASTGNENCRSHFNLWDPASSQTAKTTNLYFGFEFADGAIATGEKYTDNVTIGGFTADIQTIGAARTYSSNLAASEFAPDGILGLAFPSLIEDDDQSLLLHTLFNEGKLPQPVFSLKLTASGGELYVGGMNEALYIGNSLAFTPVTKPGLWELKIDNIKLNNEIVLTDVPAIIDTGSYSIFGDSSRVLALHQACGGKAFEKGYYTFPCRSFPSMTLTIGGKPFLIPANVLEQGRVTSGSRDCFSGITTYDTDHYDSWTIGTIFLQRFYTVFDFGSESPRVGFAKLARMPIT